MGLPLVRPEWATDRTLQVAWRRHSRRLAGDGSVFWTGSSKAAGWLNATDKKPLGVRNRMIDRIAPAAQPEKFSYGRWIVVTGQNVPTPVCPALGSNGAMPRLLSTLETVINSCRKTFGATG